MNAKMICLLVGGIGMLVWAGAWYWGNSLGGQVAWSEADAQQYAAAGGKLHQVTYEHAASQQSSGKMLGGMNRVVADGELAVTQDAWATQRDKRDAAIRFTAFWHNVLFGAGMLMICGGGVGYFIIKGMTEDT
ncbi:MAG TPA: hypothetical protein VL096_21695 [Pirellulaceae bacterium]|nr:hypothetical protein [Pirellulaceae bacterium]